MSIDRTQTLNYVKAFDLKNLFIQELGWDNPKLRQSVPLQVEGVGYNILPVAEKAGMMAFNLKGQLPERKIRHKLYREASKQFHELLIVFTDSGNTEQRWLWMRREPGKPDAARESVYSKGQDGELLFQKLQALAFTFEDEELGVVITDVTRKAKKAFDVDTVTKKFYDRFQKEHANFLSFISGIEAQGDREWYASLMLNRLMFIYFIQKKRFLDGDENYLRNRLSKMQAQQGSDKFYSFYRLFLLRLFHEGLGNQPHSPELERQLGKVPYLNGGLFDVHQLERENTSIQIPDEAFERVFQFFDAYQWHLDDRPLKDDKEINPDVLGYIFEKYINQKQMGAYYTKEDITEYISKNTIIPFLFDKAHDISSNNELKTGIWQLLALEPDRYIYEAVRKGADLPLPPEIAAGLTDVSRRGGWNKPAPTEYALPTEWWREVVARRTRYQELKAKLAAGEVTSINDLITYNLNLRQFAQDVIESCEWPETVQAFYQAIARVTVLDPTCGSGAFLFAALGILEPLYQACLDRMEIFVKEAEKSPRKLGSAAFGTFNQTLADMAKHPNQRYFILKSIIINNLYGVDIMEEAVEIAKLRLFLKLVAQLDDPDHIEPLPDVDFNIRAGNTLVGFASQTETNAAIDRKFDFDNTKELIDQKAKEVERGFRNFRELQLRLNLKGNALAEGKRQLQTQLQDLNEVLNHYLAGEYGVNQDKIKKGYEEAFRQWHQTHQPFHWWVEFYSIMHEGGFDVVIGNPPYVEYSKVKGEYTVKGYQTESSGNLYAFIMERSLLLTSSGGRCGLIVPVSLLCTERTISSQKILFNDTQTWNCSFDTSPSQLFSGVSQRLTINLVQKQAGNTIINVGGYRRWHNEERAALLFNTSYTEVRLSDFVMGYIPKISFPVESMISTKLKGQLISHFEAPTHQTPLYIHRIIRYFIKAVDFIPYFWNETDGQKKSEDYKPFYLQPNVKNAIAAAINSSLFYWFWHSYSDGFHCGYRDVRAFGLGNFSLSVHLPRLNELGILLMQDLEKNTTRKIIVSKATGRIEYDEFNPRQSKPIIDEIDWVLAQHYGFTDEELDFIINYDIKYRMGKDAGEREE